MVGRQMGWIGLMLMVMVMVMVAALQNAEAATNYTVGDDVGWRIPSSTSFYTEWASNKTFEVGDILVFNWTGEHDVLELTSEAEFGNCTKTNGTPQTASPVTIRLTKNATRYFICAVGQHCNLGQKIEIKVGLGSNGTSSPPPSSAPNSPFSFSLLFAVLAASVIYCSCSSA